MSRLVLVAAVLAARCSALHMRLPASRMIRAPTTRMVSDDDLMASLRARLSTQESGEKGGAPVPLGPDEVGADSMGPMDVVDYIMRALVANDKPSTNNGLRTLLGFSVAHDDGQQEDKLGQVQPGCFGSPEALETFFSSHNRYSSLSALDEFKPMGPPTTSNMSRNAVQKLLVRTDGANWKDLFVNLSLSKTQVGESEVPRWLVVSIYMSGN